METTTLLTYYFPSQPYPLEVSTNNHAMNGSLTVVVSDPGNDIYAESIEIYLPIGAGQPGYLSSNTPLASCNTSRWAIGTASLVKPEELPPVLRVSGKDGSQYHYVLYNCTPQTASDQLIDYDLNFTFQITGVDTFTGPYVIGIGEVASKSANGFGNTVYAAFTSLKAQASFVLKNFVASAAQGDVNVPIGAIARNTGFRLSWESNGSSFTLYEAQNPTSIYQGTDTQFNLAGGITTDTTFILQATLDASQTGDGSGFESSVLYDTLTVTCSNADLVTNSIQNATTINSTGDISTQGALNATGAATLGRLHVSGASSLDGTLTVAEGATLGSLQVSGASRLAVTTINEELEVLGTSSLAGVTAGNLNVSGPLVANVGSVQMFGTPQVLLDVPEARNGNYSISGQATTDGFILGNCGVVVAGNKCNYSLTVVVTSSDPSIPLFQSSVSNFEGTTNSISLTIPVRKGDSYMCIWMGSGAINSISISYWFFGLGGQ